MNEYRPSKRESQNGKYDEEDSEEEEIPGDHGLGRIFRLARPEWGWLAVGLFFLCGSIAPRLILPIAFGQMIDIIIDDDVIHR